MRAKWIGLDALKKKFKGASAGVHPNQKTALEESLLYLHQETPEYPPKPPDSTYVRKGSAGLGGSITAMMGEHPDALSRVEGLGGNVQGIWGTGRSYGPFVVDEHRQAKVHQGRWWTMQGVFREKVPGIVKIFKKYFRWPIIRR